MEKCSFGEGTVFKPDGVNELDPCRYEVVARLKNVTVEVLRCKRCGHVEISWKKQDNTEEILDED
jgi:hypothetical protein